MSLYSVVDDGYDVDVFRTYKALWLRYSGSNMYLDPDNTRAYTKASLRTELKLHGEARVYEEGGSDWYWKIVEHKE